MTSEWTFVQICGAVGLLCSAWNLFGDLYYLDFYTAHLGDQEFGQIRDLSDVQAGRLFRFDSGNWWVVFLAQSGGWMYPIWAFVTAVPLYMGLSSPEQGPSFWKTLAPCLLLTYGLCVIGGALHSAFAFVTVLPSVYHSGASDWSNLAGSQDFPLFLKAAQTRIVQHIGVGFFPGYVACNVAGIWIAILVHFRPTLFPKYFNFFNPLATMVWVQIIGSLLPDPWGFYFVGCLGTCGMMMFNIGSTYCLWNHGRDASSLSSQLLQPPDFSTSEMNYKSVEHPLN